MTFDLEAKNMYTLKGIGYYWINEKPVSKYSNFWATVVPIELVFFFPCSYTMESEFSHMHY